MILYRTKVQYCVFKNVTQLMRRVIIFTLYSLTAMGATAFASSVGAIFPEYRWA